MTNKTVKSGSCFVKSKIQLFFKKFLKKNCFIFLKFFFTKFIFFIFFGVFFCKNWPFLTTLECTEHENVGYGNKDLQNVKKHVFFKKWKKVQKNQKILKIFKKFSKIFENFSLFWKFSVLKFFFLCEK